VSGSKIGPVAELSIEQCEQLIDEMFQTHPELREAHRIVAVRERARRGGLSAAERLTPAERTERARKAARARWDNPETGKGV
jgi:hypothetical protein